VPNIAAASASLPRVGQTFQATITNLPLQGLAFVFLGLSNTSYGPTPLPLSLNFLGGTGCSVLASGDEGGTVRLWSVASGEELCSLEGQHADYIRGLAFAPSGRTLASADEGGVAIWFVDEEQARCRFGYRLVDLESPTEALRFAGDGSALVVVGRDGVIRRYARALWAPRDSLLALARRRLRGRELSPAEIERYTRLR
jgi:WD40 repeat protein